jgi:hypothetical protein
MTHDETVKVLTLVKGNWMRQPTDDLTIGVWRHIFAAADVRDVMAAVMRAIQTMPNQDRIPTAGELLQLSHDERKSRMLAENAHRPRLEARTAPISPEAVEKGRATLREAVATIAAKMRMKNR